MVSFPKITSRVLGLSLVVEKQKWDKEEGEMRSENENRGNVTQVKIKGILIKQSGDHFL